MELSPPISTTGAPVSRWSAPTASAMRSWVFSTSASGSTSPASSAAKGSSEIARSEDQTAKRASAFRTAAGVRSQRARDIEPPANGAPSTTSAGSDGARASQSAARTKSGSRNDGSSGDGAGRTCGIRPRSTRLSYSGDAVYGGSRRGISANPFARAPPPYYDVFKEVFEPFRRGRMTESTPVMLLDRRPAPDRSERGTF